MRPAPRLAVITTACILVLTGCDVVRREAPGQAGRPAAPAQGNEGAVAKAGDMLRLGQSARVPFRDGDKEGTLQVTVKAIEKGAPADLASLRIRDRDAVAGKEPYYIRATVTNVGDSDLSFTQPDSMQGALADGSEAGSIFVAGDFTKCDSTSFPGGSTKGHAMEFCSVALANPGSAVVEARWISEPFGYEGFVGWKS